MKNRLFFKLLILAVVTVFSVTSCKDYDDDVNRLQKQIDELKGTIANVQGAVDKGAVITAVNSVDNGIEITLSNGKKYTVTNGQPGHSPLVTIGENGNWFIDGVDQNKPSRGEKGNAPKITIGENGNWFIDGVDQNKPSTGAKPEITINAEGNWVVDGKDTGKSSKAAASEYYVPNADGYWHKIMGTTDTKTDQKWLPEGTITAVFKDGVLELHNVEGGLGDNGVVTLGTATISGLILLPDYVSDEGGALPIMNFSPLVTKCGDIAPSTLVSYMVNPSNANVSQIDTENLSFTYNNPKVLRSAAINPRAEFVDLKNGILTVRAKINTAELEKPNSGRIDQIMLNVPLKNGGTVHSDWARVAASPIADIALVRKPKTTPAWSGMELVKTVAAAKALAKNHPTVVELAYNETLDLLPIVKTMLKEGAWSDFNIDTYGLGYVFDLKDERGKTITYKLGKNQTEQQEFIVLNGSEVSTKVYSLEGPNPASVDRTPIVHVKLMSKTNEVSCAVLDGFIKFNIVRPTVQPIPPVVIPVKGNVEARCADFTLKVGTKEMNEKFYAKAKLSKTEFHNAYTWEQLTGGVGTITQVKDTEEEHSYNLVWTVSEDELWENVGKTIKKEGQYVHGDNVIKVTFTANVTQPAIDLSALLLDNYWDAAKTYTTHNVAVPADGATDPAECTYANNINNAFQTKGHKLDLAFANPKYAKFTYEYVFDKMQPITSVRHDDGETVHISVSKDMKKLQARKGVGALEDVAVINPQSAEGDILAYQENDLAKWLLNKGPEFMQARLRLVVKNECDKEVKVNAVNGKDSFLVHFLRPVNISAAATDNFVDAVDFGTEGSYIDIMKVAQLSDWRNYKKSTNEYNFDPNHTNYYQYYGVEAITVDKDKIVPEGLTVNGKALTELPETILIDQTTAGENFNGKTYKYGRLTYKNNGVNLVDEFTLIVPVTVTYKWGEVVTRGVRVKVLPTRSNP